MRQFRLTAWLLLAIAAVSAGIIGCNSGAEATVEGEVTLDGEPIKEGTISFIPADGQTATAGGRIENGKYSVSVPPGPKRVEITATKVIGQRPAYEDVPDSPMIDITESIVPEHYNTQSELTLDVQPGTNEQNFELKS